MGVPKRKLDMDWNDPEQVRAYYREYNKTRKENDPTYREKLRELGRKNDKKRAAKPGFYKERNKKIREWWRRMKVEDPERYKALNKKGNSKPSSKAAKKRHEQKMIKQDPMYFKKRVLKKKYGMTLEEYQEKSSAQENLCAICKQPEKSLNNITKQPLLLAVDHDHETNKIRDLLCVKCNLMLGGCGDSILILESAISYLKRHAQ